MGSTLTLLSMALAFAANASTPGGDDVTAGSVSWRIEERVIGPYHAEHEDASTDPDGRHLGYIITVGDKKCVVWDGRQGAPYDAVMGDRRGQRIYTSNDGLHFAYAARRGESWFMVVDGVEGPAFDLIDSGGIDISPDAWHWAYVAKRGAHWVVVVDGKVSPEYDGILSCVNMGYDGKHVGYIARNAGKEFVVIDGQPGPAFDAVNEDNHRGPFSIVSPTGRTAYKGRNGDEWTLIIDGKSEGPFSCILGPDLWYDRVFYAVRQGSAWQAIVDGKVWGYYESIGQQRYSQDGKHAAIVVGNAGNDYVVRDGKRESDWDNVRSLRFSWDGQHLAYEATDKAGMMRVVVDGQFAMPQETISRVELSDDGSRLAYVAEDGKRRVAVVDGQAGPAFDEVCFAGHWGLATPFSVDSKRVAYAGRNGDKWTVLVDGTPGPEFDKIVCHPHFSVDSRHVAYAGRNGSRTSIVLDGKIVGEPGDLRKTCVWFEFSPSGHHFAYPVSRDGKEFVVLDGKPGPAFDLITVVGIHFRDDDTLEYMAVRDSKLIRVRHVPIPRAKYNNNIQYSILNAQCPSVWNVLPYLDIHH